MAKNVSIPITNEGDGAFCTALYFLRIRKTSGGGWTTLPNQYSTPIILSNLDDETEYELGATRKCCDGPVSDEATITFSTHIDS